jgi:predicted exporter
MIRKAGLTLAFCAVGAIVLLIFHGWRQGALSLLPISMTFC